MSTTTQQQNQESSSSIDTIRRTTAQPIVAVLVTSLLGALIFSLKVQAGLASLNIGDHLAILAADPVGTTMMGVVVWVFVGIPAAGGIALADTGDA